MEILFKCASMDQMDMPNMTMIGIILSESKENSIQKELHTSMNGSPKINVVPESMNFYLRNSWIK